MSRRTPLACLLLLTAFACSPTELGWQQAPIEFQDSPTWWEPTLGAPALDFAWGDIDRDGDLDLASLTLSGARVWRNDDGTLVDWCETTTGADRGGVSLADIDDDGWLELTLSGSGEDGLSGFFEVYQLGPDTCPAPALWEPTLAFTTAAGTSDHAWADLDRDGYPDLALGNSDVSETNTLYRNNIESGGGVDEITWSIGTQAPTTALAWGFFTEDDFPDLAEANGISGLASNSRIFASDAGGTLPGVPLWTDPNAHETTCLAWADLNLDGAQDVAFGTFIGSPTLALNDGSGGAVSDNLSTGDQITGCAAGRATGSAAFSLALVRDGDSHELRAFPGDTTSWESGLFERGRAAAWGDLDGDGDLELVVGSLEGATRIYSLDETPVDEGPFEDEFAIALTGEVSAIAHGDLDGDGVAEMVAAAPGKLEIIGGLGFGETRTFDNRLPSDASPPTDLELVELDGDGRLDLVLTTESPGVQLWLTAGGPLPSDRSELIGPDAAADVAPGDFDLDGDLDLLVSWSEPSSSGATATLYENRAGSWAPVWETTGSTAYDVGVVADFSGDGWPDVLLGGAAGTHLHLNEGPLPAAAPTWTLAGMETTALLPLDRDGDGDLDLIQVPLIGTGPNPVRLYLNPGEGNLYTDSAIAGFGARAAALGDVDEDGDSDLILGFGDTLDVVYTNRNGAFIGRHQLNDRFGARTRALSVASGSSGPPTIGRGADSGAVWLWRSQAHTLETETEPWLWSQPSTPARIQLLIPDHSAQHSAPGAATESLSIPFALFHPLSEPVAAVHIEWSPTGEPPWQTATTLEPVDPDGGWATSPDGVSHNLTWLLSEDQAFSDRAAVRLHAIYYPRRIATSAQRPASAATTGPLRVRACGDLDLIDTDGDGWQDCLESGDCLDAPDRFPGADELCDGFDGDCDGVIPTEEQDLDADGERPCEGDCDDSDPSRFSSSDESCNGIDDDCSGLIGPAELDSDGDGYVPCDDWSGDPTLQGGDCDDSDPAISPADDSCGRDPSLDIDDDGFSVEEGDCDDTDATLNPDAEELCDGIDNNCDGDLLDDEIDADGDGAPGCEDCDDDNPLRSPLFGELCDGIDNNCDNLTPATELDQDGDLIAWCEGDCNDGDPTISPLAAEDCTDGIDNNCDGSIDVDTDQDFDGYSACGEDCDDLDPTINPDSVEICNGRDDNCDGAIDEDQDDEDSDGWAQCVDCDDADPTIYPGAPELCDGIDNDCDPNINELVDGDLDGFAACDDPGDCQEGRPDIYPDAPELCDGIDNNCDGAIDEIHDLDLDGWTTCAGDCDDTDPSVYLGALEICENGLDDDCAGDGDEACEEPVIVPPPGCGCSQPDETGQGSRLFVSLLPLLVHFWTRRTRNSQRSRSAS